MFKVESQQKSEIYSPKECCTFTHFITAGAGLWVGSELRTICRCIYPKERKILEIPTKAVHQPQIEILQLT